MDGTKPLEFTVSEQDTGQRLDRFLRQHLWGVSRGSVLRLIQRRLVLVDGQSQAKGHLLRLGQTVVVAAAARSEHPQPQPDLPLEVIQELPDLVVINKPPSMACHPLVPGETDTVANALVARYPECLAASANPREGGLAHRLDWSTSGVLLAARNPQAYGKLRGLFSSHQVVKDYLALVQGQVQTERVTVDDALQTMPGDRRRMQVVQTFDRGHGLAAETQFSPVETLSAFCLVRAHCRTGRRHQVRVHLAHAGHPLVGDTLYGGPALAGVQGPFLHAEQVVLPGVSTPFRAPLPAQRGALLQTLRQGTEKG